MVSSIYTGYTDKINQSILEDASKDMLRASRYLKFRQDFEFGSTYYIRYSEQIDSLHNSAEQKLILLHK